MDSTSGYASGDGASLHWFARGMRNILSVPAIILMSSFVGFAGFSRESGIDLAHAVFMTAAIWALPAQVVLVASIQAGMTLLPISIAVALSSVRLMPLVSTLVPEMRAEKTRTATLLFLSHFIAVTSWVVATERFGRVPRQYRTAFFAGFAVTLTTINVIIVAAVYKFSAGIPAMALGALFFLTPNYFLTSLWATARDHVVKIAMVFGLALGPVFHVVVPEFDLLLAGIVGGVLAFLAGRRLSIGGERKQ